MKKRQKPVNGASGPKATPEEAKARIKSAEACLNSLLATVQELSTAKNDDGMIFRSLLTVMLRVAAVCSIKTRDIVGHVKSQYPDMKERIAAARLLRRTDPNVDTPPPAEPESPDNSKTATEAQ